MPRKPQNRTFRPAQSPRRRTASRVTAGMEATVERLERLVATAIERLANVPVPQATFQPMPSVGDALQLFIPMLSKLTENVTSERASTAKLIDDLLEKAAKNALRSPAQEMARRSVASREKKRAAVRESEEMALPQLPLFVSACEECQALLHNRPAVHTTDVLRHANEHHMADLRTLGIIGAN